MTINYKHYPTNWLTEVRPRILARANNCCEQCGVQNHTWVKRDREHNNSVYVVLTIHHMGTDKPDGTKGDHTDKMDCRDENLIALCQRCHLAADRELRKAVKAGVR